jgi:cytidyltransferase-like protein
MIIKKENLAETRDQHKNEKIVLTSGTFDLIHPGHVRYLDAVKPLGDVLVVMMSGDDRAIARKRKPIMAENDRAFMLDALKVVDYVFIDPATNSPNEIDPVHAEIVKQLQPDIYATDGEDPRFWNIMDPAKLKVVERTGEEISTTDIIQRIQDLA